VCSAGDGVGGRAVCGSSWAPCYSPLPPPLPRPLGALGPASPCAPWPRLGPSPYAMCLPSPSPAQHSAGPRLLLRHRSKREGCTVSSEWCAAAGTLCSLPRRFTGRRWWCGAMGLPTMWCWQPRPPRRSPQRASSWGTSWWVAACGQAHCCLGPALPSGCLLPGPLLPEWDLGTGAQRGAARPRLRPSSALAAAARRAGHRLPAASACCLCIHAANVCATAPPPPPWACNTPPPPPPRPPPFPCLYPPLQRQPPAPSPPPPPPSLPARCRQSSWRRTCARAARARTPP
jgi:hypothetical protein